MSLSTSSSRPANTAPTRSSKTAVSATARPRVSSAHTSQLTLQHPGGARVHQVLLLTRTTRTHTRHKHITNTRVRNETMAQSPARLRPAVGGPLHSLEITCTTHTHKTIIHTKSTHAPVASGVRLDSSSPKCHTFTSQTTTPPSPPRHQLSTPTHKTHTHKHTGNTPTTHVKRGSKTQTTSTPLVDGEVGLPHPQRISPPGLRPAFVRRCSRVVLSGDVSSGPRPWTTPKYAACLRARPPRTWWTARSPC